MPGGGGDFGAFGLQVNYTGQVTAICQ
jgi:hypothetical protein